MLDMVGQPGGPLADAALWPLEVVDAVALTPSFRRVVFTAPGLGELRHAPGQDLMLRIPLGGDRVVNRRYTIRRLDRAASQVAVDVSLHGAGPGTDWISAAEAGARIDAIGPRGKITVRPDADWHLFVADETGLPGALAMLETLPADVPGRAVFEVDTEADEQDLEGPAAGGREVRWLRRDGRSVPGDQEALLGAAADVALPMAPGTPTSPPRRASCGP